MNDASVAAATEDLGRRLDAAADARVRDHWTAYLKGAATFRGVPMAGVRAAMRATWKEHALAAEPVEDLLGLAHAWFALPATEDKLAAVLLLAEQIPDRLELRHLPALAVPFEAGHLGDWNAVDWYSVKAIAAFAAHRADTPERVAAVAAWARTPRLWQRRAAAVSLVPLAPAGDGLFPGFVDLCLDVCRWNVEASTERWAHTGPGWLLRELSIPAPDAVRSFVDATAALSPEGRRMATARLRAGTYRRR